MLLKYLGTEDNGGSNQEYKIFLVWVEALSSFIMKELLLQSSRYERKTITWPDEVNKGNFLSHFGGWTNCVGIIDVMLLLPSGLLATNR